MNDKKEGNQNLRRSEVRSESKLCDGVRSSLQECSLEENQAKLEAYIDSFKDDTSRQTNIKALLYILQCLSATVQTPTVIPTATTRTSTLSYMTFNDAFDMFKSFRDATSDSISSEKDQKIHFRDLLCSRQYGLCIYLARIQGCEYVILKPDSLNFSLDHLLLVLCNKKNEMGEEELTREYCQDLIGTMESEWDKCILRVLLAHGIFPISSKF